MRMNPEQEGIHALGLNLSPKLRSLFKPIALESVPL